LRRAPLALGLPIAAGFVWAVFAKLPDRDVMACIGYFFGGVAVYGMALRGWLRPATLLPLGALLVAGAFWAWNGWQSRDMVILAGTFAALCLTLALDLADRHDRFAIGRKLGDASYGIYLWHFPLQLMLVLLIDETVGTRRIAASPPSSSFSWASPSWRASPRTAGSNGRRSAGCSAWPSGCATTTRRTPEPRLDSPKMPLGGF
jgi:peptidoglycan/LPS O-acetylase OafA/YrhL